MRVWQFILSPDPKPFHLCIAERIVEPWDELIYVRMINIALSCSPTEFQGNEEVERGEQWLVVRNTKVWSSLFVGFGIKFIAT